MDTRTMRITYYLGAILCIVVTAATVSYRVGLHQVPTINYASEHRGHLSRLERNAAPGRVVFIGSSTFQGLDVSSVTPIGLNLGLGGDLMDGLIERARNYQSLKTAAAVVINVGLNDILLHCAHPNTNPEQLFSIAPLPTPLIVVGIQGIANGSPPRKCENQLPELIYTFNLKLENACQRRPRCYYVRSPVSSLKQDGDNASFQEADGIHLNSAGYLRLGALLRQRLRDAGINAVHTEP